VVVYHRKKNIIIEVNNMSGIPLLNEKCVGAFVASAIGDALGWPNEFRSSNNNKRNKPLSNFVEWQRHTGGRFWNHTEKILAGEYSDDTQMKLAVARSLLSGKEWSSHFVSLELPFWLEYERGGGGAMLRAAKCWKKKVEPWQSKDSNSYFGAGGNGAAMRILPHIIFHNHSSSFEPIADEVGTDATITHGHPRAIVGALCYAYALYYLVKKQNTLSFGELIAAVSAAQSEWGRFPRAFTNDKLNIVSNRLGYHKLWDDTVESTMHTLEIVSNALNKGALDSDVETLTKIGCFDKKINGAGDIAAVASIYLASKYANNPTLGIKSAANALGSDTDTIASMTGGLLGAICGMEWIPAEWKLVQDFDCLVQMANFLLSENGVEAVKEYVVNNKQEQLQWERTPMGICKKISTYELPSGRTGTVRVTKYVTALGQTFYIKKFFREKASDNYITQLTGSPKRKCSLTINSLQVAAMVNDTDLNAISFLTVLRILEMVSQGVTNIALIAQKAEVSMEGVRKVMSLIVADKQ
jgi:ADP-ribosylglycohydrolase